MRALRVTFVYIALVVARFSELTEANASLRGGRLLQSQRQSPEDRDGTDYSTAYTDAEVQNFPEEEGEVAPAEDSSLSGANATVALGAESATSATSAEEEAADVTKTDTDAGQNLDEHYSDEEIESFPEAEESTEESDDALYEDASYDDAGDSNLEAETWEDEWNTDADSADATTSGCDETTQDCSFMVDAAADEDVDSDFDSVPFEDDYEDQSAHYADDEIPEEEYVDADLEVASGCSDTTVDCDGKMEDEESPMADDDGSSAAIGNDMSLAQAKANISQVGSSIHVRRSSLSDSATDVQEAKEQAEEELQRVAAKEGFEFGTEGEDQSLHADEIEQAVADAKDTAEALGEKADIETKDATEAVGEQAIVDAEQASEAVEEKEAQVETADNTADAAATAEDDSAGYSDLGDAQEQAETADSTADAAATAEDDSNGSSDLGDSQEQAADESVADNDAEVVDDSHKSQEQAKDDADVAVDDNGAEVVDDSQKSQDNADVAVDDSAEMSASGEKRTDDVDAAIADADAVAASANSAGEGQASA